MNNQYLYGTNPYSLPQQKQFGNTINWVQGVEAAKAFQLMPNSNVIMMDSENDGVFYIKTSDNVGMCNMRTFRYEEVTNTPANTQSVDLSEYVRKDELKALLQEVTNEQAIPATTDTESGPKPLIQR